MDTSHTIEKIKEKDADQLLNWIQQHQPTLLQGGNIDKFKEAEISERAFLIAADNVEFIRKECNLPAGPSLELPRLASELAERETAVAKSKLLSFMPWTPRRQQANNVTRNRQQAEDVEMSDAADMKSKLLSFIPCIPCRQQANNFIGLRKVEDAFKAGIRYKRPRSL